MKKLEKKKPLITDMEVKTKEIEVEVMRMRFEESTPGRDTDWNKTGGTRALKEGSNPKGIRAAFQIAINEIEFIAMH